MRWLVFGVAVLTLVSGTADSVMSVPPGEAPVLAGCQVVLFHSALGVRRGVVDWAKMLESHAHDVVTPDFFDGATFDDYPEALEALEARGGIQRYMEWTARVGGDLKGPVVFMGFSNGAGSAQYLAATYPEAKGAVLMHGALPLAAFGLESWPSAVPVQVHYAEDDPFRHRGSVEALESTVRAAGASFEYVTYGVTGHLFADPDLAEYDEHAAVQMAEHALRFLDSLCRSR